MKDYDLLIEMMMERYADEGGAGGRRLMSVSPIDGVMTPESYAVLLAETSSVHKKTPIYCGRYALFYPRREGDAWDAVWFNEETCRMENMVTGLEDKEATRIMRKGMHLWVQLRQRALRSLMSLFLRRAKDLRFGEEQAVNQFLEDLRSALFKEEL